MASNDSNGNPGADESEAESPLNEFGPARKEKHRVSILCLDKNDRKIS